MKNDQADPMSPLFPPDREPHEVTNEIPIDRFAKKTDQKKLPEKREPLSPVVLEEAQRQTDFKEG